MKQREEGVEHANEYCANSDAVINTALFILVCKYNICDSLITESYFINWFNRSAENRSEDAKERTWRMIKALQECML